MFPVSKRMAGVKPDSINDESSEEEATSDSSSTRTMAGNDCDNEQCHPIYPKGDQHIKQRMHQDEKILGSKDQFCAAFYHVPECDYWPRNGLRQHFCLDEDKCVIGNEAKESMRKFREDAQEFIEGAQEFLELVKEFDKCAKQSPKPFATKVQNFEEKVLTFDEKAQQFLEAGNKVAAKANEFYEYVQEFQVDADALYENVNKFGDFIKTLLDETKKMFQKKKLKEVLRKGDEFFKKQIFASKGETGEKMLKAATAWYTQPKATVAIVKFQKVDGSILYEARYTNCTSGKKLAEDFFEEDIKKGIFKKMVEWNPNGTVTLYLTLLHPCNKSTGVEEDSNEEEREDSNEEEEEDSNEEEEESAEESQSSCAILKRIVTEILRKNGRQIKLFVKPTNVDLLRQEDGTLHERTAREIKDLMSIEDVNVSEMTQKDWNYLFWMTKEFSNRQVLDREVQKIFDQICRINRFEFE